MRHDYDLPPDWEARSDEEKSRWMTQERCRRQASRQGTSPSKSLQAERRRRDRVLAARGYESVKQKR